MPSGAPRPEIPCRETLLQRIEQSFSERRQPANHEQHHRRDHELAAKRCKARDHQNGADEADADQEVRRQQQEADRF